MLRVKAANRWWPFEERIHQRADLLAIDPIRRVNIYTFTMNRPRLNVQATRLVVPNTNADADDDDGYSPLDSIMDCYGDDPEPSHPILTSHSGHSSKTRDTQADTDRPAWALGNMKPPTRLERSSSLAVPPPSGPLPTLPHNSQSHRDEILARGRSSLGRSMTTTAVPTLQGSNVNNDAKPLLAPSLSMRKNRKGLTLGGASPVSPGNTSRLIIENDDERTTDSHRASIHSSEGSTSASSSWMSERMSTEILCHSSSSSVASTSSYSTVLSEHLANLELASSNKYGAGSKQYDRTSIGGVSTLSDRSSSRDNHGHGSLINSSSSSSNSQEPTRRIKIEQLNDANLKVVHELGHGNGGTVSQVHHAPSGLTMARKVVQISTTETSKKQIMRELQIMHDCVSPYLVTFYGAYVKEPHICMCMEYMDCGSLDNIYKKYGPIPENILGHIAFAVVSGLTFLYDSYKIMHRDVKPSNILMNRAGDIKMCDFGVSGELIDSVTDTFVGTSMYMSPERISGAPYTVQSDVWSLGITLVELALGQFPFSDSGDDDDDDDDDYFATDHTVRARQSTTGTYHAKTENRRQVNKPAPQPRAVNQLAVLELLQYIVNEPAPELPADKFSEDVVEFTKATLLKDPPNMGEPAKKPRRPTPKDLLSYPWMRRVQADKSMDVAKFAQSLVD